uniref:PinX1-related protein 1 n=1 Tax=Eucampia antarctica TaxID=49252 RepID=A0A7S2WGB8_9STRA|mmetsp:Transcript_28993/g.27902  ORF Transcript_28993/g.27902 Transcript_28993/m.27902 type:complete len:258 (+) Transcript_28993:135-908(+)|eukprot:CAMPEP_0197832876 /NCGR_PEP_ID=MMETSP1437-20131217/16591_1 /TAXON_ID=49252 ORGANISM="Eucampia antarctica, Strain CCMP1452" /NCGR_SAMPLE_ID=MMETSP1437 /ASSEMBLY_ACC=CAM_ASM_001096 /LENGTH=257 /DNA_ID=CAMNT_0043436503 /DNA_START=104 /DNA_END=877 /DNA_ORIENTATION=+
MSIKADVDTRNEKWAKDKSAFGQRMLAKMGWEEGKGLGKNKQGTVNNIRAVRRSESLGIGASTDLHGEEGFNSTKNNFLGVLEKLKQEHGGKKGKKNKKSKKKSKATEGGVTLAQNRVSAGHSRKMRESKDLSKKSKEDMAAIFGVKVDAYTASSSVWGSLKQSSVSISENQDIKPETQPQETTNHVISEDPTSASSDADVDSPKMKKLEKETKKKKKKDKSSDKISSLKKKKKKRSKDEAEMDEESKRRKKKSRKK